jgi:hypothetical protein
VNIHKKGNIVDMIGLEEARILNDIHKTDPIVQNKPMMNIFKAFSALDTLEQISSSVMRVQISAPFDQVDKQYRHLRNLCEVEREIIPVGREYRVPPINDGVGDESTSKKRGPNIGTISKVAHARLIIERKGKKQKHACQLASVDPKTLRKWLDHREVQEEMERLEHDRDFLDFLEGI